MQISKPHVRMRRSRWDQKQHDEEPVPSGSRWNNHGRPSNNRVPVDWNQEPAVEVTTSSRNREILNTPHPLDYSRQSDKRIEVVGNELNESKRQKESNDSHKETTEPLSDQQPPLIQSPPSLLPTPWSYAADIHPPYSGSNSNAQIGYESQISWNQANPGYYPNYHPGVFDVKWWEEMASHMGHQNFNKEKFQPGRSSQWAKMHKNNDRSHNYDFNRRLGRYQNVPLDRNSRLYRDQRPYLPSSNLTQRYNKYDNSQMQNRVWRHNGNGRYFNSNMRQQDFPHFYDWNQNIDQEVYSSNLDKKRNSYARLNNEESHKVKKTICSTTTNNDTGTTNSVKKAKKKKVSKKNSTAEKAKKIALANAATKLKMTFFAAKKKPSKKVVKKLKDKNMIKNCSTDKIETKDKVQDLSIPKSIPKDGTSLEHDIDIKFSAQEWESVGRGEGGTRNLLDLPGSKDSKDCGDNTDTDSVQTVEDFEARESTDIESGNSESETEEEEFNVEWNNLQSLSSVKPVRRRHVSETCNATNFFENKLPNLSKARRIRSYSTGQVEEISHLNCMTNKSIPSNLKNMLVKQLLTMDKKSLVELVNNPKSHKARFMMSHFMKMHKVALSQKLNQIRFKNSHSAPNGEDDDLLILQSITNAQLENLSPDILQQVRDILAFEESGNAQEMWDEVSLSLSDLVTGMENTGTSHFGGKVSETPTIFEEDSSNSVKNCEPINVDNAEDLDCQIVTPPPKRPATTITIPDSDTDNGSEGKNSVDKTSEILPCEIKDSSNQNSSPNSPDDPSFPFIKPAELEQLCPQNLTHKSSLHSRLLSPLVHFLAPHSLRPNPAPTPSCIIQSLTPSASHFVPPLPIKQSSVLTLDDPLTPLTHCVPSLPIIHSPITVPKTISPTLPTHFVPPSPIIHPPVALQENSDQPLSPLPHFLPPHPIKQSPAPTPPSQNLNSCTPPRPSLSPSCFRSSKRVKRNSYSKSKPGDSLLQSNVENRSNLNVHTHSVKVKQERQPMIECGYCLHPPRSPHTPQCSFSFGLHPPQPISLLPGSPRPLGSSVRRPISHLPSSAIPRLFKQEISEASFVSLNHVNRPSSEERPKNPAPPDTTNSEPPSPLPIPPPQPTLHSPPSRPLIFSPDDRFSDPSRPASPPPPQHSPRIIKTERQTPQYICCCMRNECERNIGSRSSADFRPPGTPLNQLCDVANRLTPHIYKIEPPYNSGSRSRTPHSSIIGLFPMPQSPRCITTNNSGIPSINNSCLNVNDLNKVSIGVQTNKASANSLDGKRSFVPNISLARVITPLSSKIDQTTSTDDLTFEEVGHIPPVFDASCSINGENSAIETDANNDTIGENYEMFKISVNIPPAKRIHSESSSTANDLLEFAKQEMEIFKQLEILEEKSKELANERINLTKRLENIHNSRSEKLKILVWENTSVSSDNISNVADTQVSTNVHIPSLPISVANNIKKVEKAYLDNLYMVTSTQEISGMQRAESPTESYSNDSGQLNIQGQRCTSTSLIEDESENKKPLLGLELEPKENLHNYSGSDSDDENIRMKTYQRSKTKFNKVQSSFRRQRMQSVSSSEEEMEKKVIIHLQHEDRPIDNLIPNSLMDENRVDSSEVKQENVSILNTFSIVHRTESNDGETIENNNKGSLSSSPQSPKMRNSSGSEHGYSLRSRGPPSDLFDFNSDSQLSKDATLSSQEDHIDIIEEKPCLPVKNTNKSNHDDEQADDELEKEDSESKNLSNHKHPNDNFKRRKRKRKNKKMQANKSKKKDGECEAFLPEVIKFQGVVDEMSDKKEDEKNKEIAHCFNAEETIVKVPPPHEDAILDLKVVGGFIFTASSDGTARLFDPTTGLILATYVNHTDSVTAIQVVGQPDFRPIAPDFSVVTGSEDNFIHVYDGKTGVLSKSRNTLESVRCLDHRWGYLFIGTDGGCGIKWNLKDKKLGEKIQFCGKGITQLIAHIEGGRKVLVVSAKTTPIMVRDAMSGLFLRTLEYVQLTVYSAIFEGSLLYTGGADKNIYTYDFCSGAVKKTFLVGSAVSSLLIFRNHLIATCYDGYIRIFKLPSGELINCIAVEQSPKMYICSTLYKDKILLGNRSGEIVNCQLPMLCN